MKTAPEYDGLDEFLENRKTDYYRSVFSRINESAGFVWTRNVSAMIWGPIWFGINGIWGWMLGFIIFESLALTLVGRGFWADLTKSVSDRIASVDLQLSLRQSQLEAAIAGNKSNVEALRRNIDGLQSIIEQSRIEAQQIEDGRIWLVAFGLVLFLALRSIQMLIANPLLARKFLAWQSKQGETRLSRTLRLILATALFLGTIAINFAYYVFAVDIPVIQEFPSPPAVRDHAVSVIETTFDFLTIKGDAVFDAISFGIRVVLDFLETVFVQTPWMIVAGFVIVITALSANVAAAATTAAFLAYIGLMDLWTLAMQTLALLGTAACISICLGIPLGIFSARRPRFYRFIRPILDMQQTMPTFVYMIPIIAFFGTGKSAAVVTCLIFGMPPVIRLTVLGIQGVPDSIREAAIAYGASEWYLMTRIELPLAAPSIRAGINQTILLSLLTVVVASLIGAKGLGEDVLEALQYASIGQGLLAGIAILFIAKILDRIFMGAREGV